MVYNYPKKSAERLSGFWDTVAGKIILGLVAAPVIMPAAPITSTTLITSAAGGAALVGPFTEFTVDPKTGKTYTSVGPVTVTPSGDTTITPVEKLLANQAAAQQAITAAKAKTLAPPAAPKNYNFAAFAVPAGIISAIGLFVQR